VQFRASPEGWRTCYFIGGGLGFLLLLLRVGVLESGMYKIIAQSNVQRGNFFMLFTSGNPPEKVPDGYLHCFAQLYVIGI